LKAALPQASKVRIRKNAQYRRREDGRGPKASPYTIKNLDDAIAHLEVAIAADSAMAIFGHRYWRDRVQKIGSTRASCTPKRVDYGTCWSGFPARHEMQA
jgi:hypothetical protein